MNPLKQYSPQAPASTARLCSGCKFYRQVFTRTSGTCTLCGDIDLVTGSKQPMPASLARTFGPCGEEGRFYVRGASEPPALFYIPDLKEALASAAYPVKAVFGPVATGFLFMALLYTLSVHIEST